MPESETVRLRLLRDDDRPPSPDGSAFRLGVQDRDGNLVAGIPRADGRLAFELELTVKADPGDGRPVFTGRFASGPRDARFVYLSWQRLDGKSYVNRMKARLAELGWPLIRAAQESGCPVEADLGGRKAGGGTVPVDWRLGAP